MADSAETEPQDKADAEDLNAGTPPTRDRTTHGAILSWMITLLVAVLSAGIGLALGRLFAASRAPEPVEARPEAPPFLVQTLEDGSPATDVEKNWYYDLEPVTVNLNEPSFRHHVRASVTLEIGSGLEPSKGRAFLEHKKTLMVDRLTICLAGLSREDIRGEGRIEKVQVQIRDAFNEELFGGSEPHIRQVLLKHLAVQ